MTEEGAEEQFSNELTALAVRYEQVPPVTLAQKLVWKAGS